MPKSKTKKTKKTKKQKNKIIIGKDLIVDTVGTNQLLAYNDINNMMIKGGVLYDEQNYKKYSDNLKEQIINQNYRGDPNEQYQLKKRSKQLYKNLVDSIFTGDGLIASKHVKKSMPYTPKKVRSKFKYDESPLTPFEIKLNEQTEENIKTKTPRKENQTIRQKVDKFLTEQSEPDKNGNYKIITPKLINEWKQRFINMKGFKDDPELSDNFSTVVLSYFDNPDQKAKDIVKRDVYIAKDEEYRRDRRYRRDKKFYESIFNGP